MTRRVRFSLITIVAIAIVLLVGYGLPYRIFQSIESSSLAIANARGRIAFLEAAGAAADINEERLRHEDTALTEIRSAFFDEKNPLRFIEAVESVGKAAGVDLSSDLLDEGASDGPSFRLTAIGTVSEALNFLYRLENAPVVVRVDQFTIQKLSADERSAHRAKHKSSSADAKLVVLIHVLESN